VLEKLAGIEFGQSKEFTRSLELDVYIIKGRTNNLCQVPNASPYWVVDHRWDGDFSPSPPESVRITNTKIATALQSQGMSNCRDIPFTIVEVQYRYTPLFATLLARGAKLPMSSYAIIQQY
jgi:hypothetical protein